MPVCPCLHLRVSVFALRKDVRRCVRAADSGVGWRVTECARVRFRQRARACVYAHACACVRVCVYVYVFPRASAILAAALGRLRPPLRYARNAAHWSFLAF